MTGPLSPTGSTPDAASSRSRRRSARATSRSTGRSNATAARRPLSALVGTQPGAAAPATPMTLLAQRPADVNEHRTPGHWEGDLIIGRGQASAIGTLVERTTRYR